MQALEGDRDCIHRTDWNVRDSDGTAFFSIARLLTGGSKRTVELAHKHGKPVIRISRDGSPIAEKAACPPRGRVQR